MAELASMFWSMLYCFEGFRTFRQQGLAGRKVTIRFGPWKVLCTPDSGCGVRLRGTASATRVHRDDAPPISLRVNEPKPL